MRGSSNIEPADDLSRELAETLACIHNKLTHLDTMVACERERHNGGSLEGWALDQMMVRLREPSGQLLRLADEYLSRRFTMSDGSWECFIEIEED